MAIKLKARYYQYQIYLPIIVLLATTFTWAQWSTDPAENTIVNDNPGAQIYPLITTDMKGGAIVVWVERFTDLYAQRIDRYGYLRWDQDGVPVRTETNTVRPEAIISDGKGGAIILWMDYREYEGLIEFDYTPNSLYTQRIDSSGVAMWQENGVVVRSYLDTVYTPTLDEGLAADLRGGAYIVWRDPGDGWRENKVFAQHIDSTGGLLWQKNGKLIRKGYYPRIVSDNSGGVYIIVSHFGMRYDYKGEKLWSEEVFIDSAGLGKSKRVIPDGKGGFIYAGFRFPGGYQARHYIGIQRVNREDNLLWNNVRIYPDGRVLSYSLSLISDSYHGAIVSWQMDYNYNVYSQRIDSTGKVLWQERGIPYGSRVAVSNGMGGFLYAYSLSDSVYKRYVHKISYDGLPQWGEKGVLFTYRKKYLHGWGVWQAISDGNGGVIFVWDERNPETQSIDILAQQVSRNGKLGEVITILQHEKHGSLPQQVKLFPNYPNPFNDTTVIRYTLPTQALLRIAIYSIKGQLVKELINQIQGGGEYHVTWDGTNQYGKEVSSGIYFCQLKTDKAIQATKLLYLK